MPEVEFTQLVKTSSNMKKILDVFGLKNKGNNFHTVKKRIDHLQLDTSHFLRRTEASARSREVTLEELYTSWLIEGSSRNRTHLKNHILNFSLLSYRCCLCPNVGMWQGQKLTLQLDHINGVDNDNRLTNLRLLCPNCHSQTKNFAGKSRR